MIATFVALWFAVVDRDDVRRDARVGCAVPRPGAALCRRACARDDDRRAGLDRLGRGPRRRERAAGRSAAGCRLAGRRDRSGSRVSGPRSATWRCRPRPSPVAHGPTWKSTRGRPPHSRRSHCDRVTRRPATATVVVDRAPPSAPCAPGQPVRLDCPPDSGRSRSTGSPRDRAAPERSHGVRHRCRSHGADRRIPGRSRSSACWPIRASTPSVRRRR